MALDEAVVEKRRKSLPKLWALVEAFRRKYKGTLHSNWGSPFSVRTRVNEGQLEVDFAEKELLLRFERLQLPAGTSFTTNRKLFRWPYNKKIGRSGTPLDWEVSGGPQADEAAVREFLEAPADVEDLRRLSLRKNEWISVDPDSVFLTIATGGFARLDAVVEVLRALARRHAAGRPSIPERARGPRLTGRQPSAALLRKWPNWRHCLGEEDEDGQDEATIRPDGEQSVIGPETSCTAFELSTTDGRRFPGFARAADADDLAKGHLEVLYARGLRRPWQVVMSPDQWKPEGSATLQLDDPLLPVHAVSVLPLPSGRRLSLVLESGGKVTWREA